MILFYIKKAILGLHTLLYSLIGLAAIGVVVLVPHNFALADISGNLDIGNVSSIASSLSGSVLQWSTGSISATHWDLDKWNGTSFDNCNTWSSTNISLSPFDVEANLGKCSGDGYYHINSYNPSLYKIEWLYRRSGTWGYVSTPNYKSLVMSTTSQIASYYDSGYSSNGVTVYKIYPDGSYSSCGDDTSTITTGSYPQNYIGTCSGDGDYWFFYDNAGLNDWTDLFMYQGSWFTGISEVNTDYTTHFISVTPVNQSTVSTTTTAGYTAYINSGETSISDMRWQLTFSQPNYSICNSNVGAPSALTAWYNSSASGNPCGSNPPSPPFTIYNNVSVAGENDYATTTTFPSGGVWNETITLQYPVTIGWGLITLWYDTFVSTTTGAMSTTTSFTIGAPSPIDTVVGGVALAQASSSLAASIHAGGIQSTTTPTSVLAGDFCNPYYYTTFNLVDCLQVLILPDPADISLDLVTLEGTIPIGWGYRLYNILTETPATTTLPALDYSFASSSPMSAIGEIHFDPFGTLGQAGTLIDSMKSDRAQPETVWQIFNTPIHIFIYIVLGLMIINDLTGIHAGGEGGGDRKGGGLSRRDRKNGFKHVTDEEYRYKEKLYNMSRK